jgi:hypothetical protein
LGKKKERDIVKVGVDLGRMGKEFKSNPKE